MTLMNPKAISQPSTQQISARKGVSQAIAANQRRSDAPLSSLMPSDQWFSLAPSIRHRFSQALEPHKPEVLIGASAIGFYGLRGDELLTELDLGKAAFSHELTDSIELANEVASYQKCRLVNLRIGLVLGHSGGPLSQLLPFYDWGLGGPIGHGKQWMSWIERDDMVRLIIHAITTKSLEGPVNAVAPHPVTNQQFSQTLGTVMKRPAFLPMPSFMVMILFGQMGKELLLSGQRVSAQKIMDSGFRFNHSRLSDALKYATGQTQSKHKTKPKVKTLPLSPHLESTERKI